jgi:hypothetical protein
MDGKLKMTHPEAIYSLGVYVLDQYPFSGKMLVGGVERGMI